MVFFDQSLEEWIDKFCRFTDEMFYCLWHLGDIVPLLITILLSNFQSAFRVEICYWSRHHFSRQAHQSSLSLCSRVYPLQSHPPNSEWQWSSVPVVLLSHQSLTCQLEWDCDHPHPTNSLFHLTTSLLSAGGPFQSPPPISGTVFLHMSHQHRRSRVSGFVSSFLFRRSSYLIIWHSKVYTLLWT